MPASNQSRTSQRNFRGADNVHLINGFPPVQKSPVLSQSKLSERAYFNSRRDNVIKSQTGSTESQPKARKTRAIWERLQSKNATKKSVCSLLDDLDPELSEKFRACHSRFLVTTCGTHTAERKATFYCGHRACVFCAEIRARRIRDKYLPKVAAFAKENPNLTPCHLVLTQKHYQSERLSDSVARLLGNFRKLARRAFWKSHLSGGGVYAVEFTRGTDGAWHTHLHCLVFRNKFFDVRAFRREWNDVTGDSVNFKIDRIANVKSGLFEIVKYISKPMDVDKFKARHLKQVLDLKSSRLFASFGAFRAFAASFVVPDEEKPSGRSQTLESGICEHCQKPLVSKLVGIAELIELEKSQSQRKRGSPKQFPRHLPLSV